MDLTPLWSILIATHTQRRVLFQRLLAGLAPQVARHPDIEVVVYYNHGALLIGDYRQALLEEAAGWYVCFIDDDDRVPDYYCDDIVNAMATRPDYVGFELEYTDATRPERNGRAFHHLRYRGWRHERGRYYRDITHLNPILRGLALRGRFQGGAGEDLNWATQVRRHVRTQAYLPKTMYYYEHNRPLSLRGNDPVAGDGQPRLELPPGFRYHPDSDQ
jgi:hypothetical protein